MKTRSLSNIIVGVIQFTYLQIRSSNKTTPDLYSIRGPSDHALPEPLKPDTGCPHIRLNQSARTAGHLLLVGTCKYLLQRHLSCRVALES